MRLTVGIALLVIVFAFATPAKAQVIMAGPDSVIVPVPDTANANDRSFFLSKWNKPAKAALFSAVVPGLGQAYNKAYWKVPVVYATGAVLAYFWIDNHNKWMEFREALNLRLTDSTDAYVDSEIYGIQHPNGTGNLKLSRDFYRRNRDLTILLSVAAYGLQIAEAYVHAHMKEFDISDNLAIRVQPNVIHAPAQLTYSPGLKLTLYTKK